MASQRQARNGGAANSGAANSRAANSQASNSGAAAGTIKTSTIKTASPPARTKGGKAAASRAQAKAARDARIRDEAAASAPPAPQTSALRQFLQRRVPQDMPDPAAWLQWAALALTLAGLGVSIYLTIVELAPATLVCSSTGIVNCENVLHSAEGHIFGIPVAYFGLAFYVYLVPLNSPWAS